MDQVEFYVPTERLCNNGRLGGYFCFEVFFNPSHKVLSDLEISVSSKGLGTIIYKLHHHS